LAIEERADLMLPNDLAAQRPRTTRPLRRCHGRSGVSRGPDRCSGLAG